MKKVFSGNFRVKGWIYIIFLSSVFFIAILTAGCSGKTQKQPVVKQDKPVNMEDYQEIECRSRAVTGSRFKRKVCATKAEWAALDDKNSKSVEELDRGIRNKSTVDSGSSTDPFGGSSMGGMPR